MPRNLHASEIRHETPSIGDLLTARPSGLTEPEAWAILCQSVQALQDLFLSDGASNDIPCIPIITPTSLLLTSRGRVRLRQSQPNLIMGQISSNLIGYMAPEYRASKRHTDTEIEKMCIYGLGETLKKATLSTHCSSARLSPELNQVLMDMTKHQPSSRASLMNLLDVISNYCKRRQQNRPFSHIIMDLHQEGVAMLELAMESGSQWGPPAMPELRPLNRNRADGLIEPPSTSVLTTMPRRWMTLTTNKPKSTKEASTSMEDLSIYHHPHILNSPGSVIRPKSMCITSDIFQTFDPQAYKRTTHNSASRIDFFNYNYTSNRPDTNNANANSSIKIEPFSSNNNNTNTNNNRIEPFDNNNRAIEPFNNAKRIESFGVNNDEKCGRKKKLRRNPVQRAASRLYRAADPTGAESSDRDCVGPEFVVRAALPSKQITISDPKGHSRADVTVIMLNGQKVVVRCNPNTTTANQLFEHIIQAEHIEENFMLGLSALIAGDFVFLPSDTRICKAISPAASAALSSTSGPAPASSSTTANHPNTSLTLYMRIRFFLPSLRGLRNTQTRHLLYLQLRRSILEHQLPCNYQQLVELNGLALQAEFGDYNQKEHGQGDYFLIEHYFPESMICSLEDTRELRDETIRMHRAKVGTDHEKAEEDFILLSQSLAHYGGHFYTATWVLKDHSQRDVWLYISPQGINLYERKPTINNEHGPLLCEMFEWRAIQTLCYSKHYLCILPHNAKYHGAKLKKYKLKMDHKKSYFAFRLASLHHQFFLRLRTEFTSLQTLSQQFGVPLKDMKNETNSLYKLEGLTLAQQETEFKIEFRASSKVSNRKPSPSLEAKYKRSKSVNDFTTITTTGHENESYQNKENEILHAVPKKTDDGLVLDSGCLSGLPIADKRRGVKMGVRAFAKLGPRVSRSMEAVNILSHEDLEQLSLQSVSIHCSSASIPQSPVIEPVNKSFTSQAYILDSTIKSCSGHQLPLPDFQESISQSLLDKLSKFSFAEERSLRSVAVRRSAGGSLGVQITEGSDGKVYVQSVIFGGPAHLSGDVQRGDQIVAVDDQDIQMLKYEDALAVLKSTGHTVKFLLSRLCEDSGTRNRNRRSLGKYKRLSLAHYGADEQVEKHVTENCRDVLNVEKYHGNITEVPYLKHIRYSELDSPKKLQPLPSAEVSSVNNNKAIIIDMIPKRFRNGAESLVCFEPDIDATSKDAFLRPIALPRSLGLSRKWRGPVKYPVTPIKKVDGNDFELTTSDEEQVFI